ncbi:tyrosine-type recombinase/integrase [Telluria aromaticivorans]|uniref:Tyrosine-type recombinase/integrase n=1 Tax=Telluria aromaticivorans TaxID=2725995 RepID=A0A7Y2JY76_9BURK|nr:site-specific integrase [Telluria aromaticivorans]NNG22750.1 tyrosine-type recombinase/integrase [Telluria aromaticivorans]
MNRQFRFNKKLIDALPPHPGDAKAKESEYSDTEVAGLRIIVNRRGRKYFLFRYSFRGAKRSMKLGDYPQMDVADARHRTLDYRAQIATGTDPQAAATVASSSQLTLRTFVTDDYLPHAYATKRSAKDDESRLRNILPEFGDLPLGQISSHSIQQFHDRLRLQKCAATANRHLALLKRCFNLAIIWGKLVGANPVRGIRMHQENNQRQRYLSGDELRSFLNALDEEASRPLADALRFLLMTGARRNEVLLARWDAIDIDKRQWFLPNTKSGKSRFVLLNDGAIELLRQRDRQAGNVYVFPGKNAGEAICNPYKGFRRVLKRAGISDLRIHDLRHSFASLAINNGATLYEVQHLLGHSDSKTSQRYAHMASDNLRKASAHVSAVIAKAQPKAIPVA